MSIEPTEYYDEYIRYFKLASDQQEKSNLGGIPHIDSKMDDDLMEHVELYDVVERKYAGFSQIVNDVFYGWEEDHPYWEKMQQGNVTKQRRQVAKAWTGKHSEFSMPEWLYVFLLHRVTGSAINYGTKPSGYHNTLLFYLHEAKTIEEMVGMVNRHPTPFYTSIGYQFPSFPKVPPGKHYKRGGDYYLSEYAPRLVREMSEWLESGGKRDLREMGEWMFEWNRRNDLRAYKFQYAAFVADIADWYPQYVNRESMFYYGTNAVECISYLAKPTKKMNKDQFLDEVMVRIYEDTGAFPYNAEDVACDFIRWVENYIRPGADYGHLDLDAIWSSCRIKNHPFGRQKAMLDLGLIETFNGMKGHPSDDAIIRQNGISPDEYRMMAKEINRLNSN
jgi:hypothetical protein